VGRKGIRKGYGRVNMVELLQTSMYEFVCISYSCIKMKKMRPVETVSGMGRGRMMEGLNSTMTCGKNSFKCHKVPPIQQ
jgi:hypothetical protein